MSKSVQLTVVFGLLILLIVVAMMGGLIDSKQWRINKVSLAAAYRHISAEQLRLKIAKVKDRSFFRFDTEKIKREIEKMTWVRSAHVAKKWPDSLQITLQEHRAMAVWNNRDLLNQNGEVFHINSAEQVGGGLPKIQAPVSQNSQTVWQDVKRFNQLLKPLGYQVKQAAINKRGDWHLQLRNGLQILLGTEQQEARILRFVETWPNLFKQLQQLPERVDLRYGNGYAIGLYQATNVRTQKVKESRQTLWERSNPPTRLMSEVNQDYYFTTDHTTG